MKSRLYDVLAHQEDNYLLPFYWQLGDHRERIPEQIERIFASGCRAVCVESRPHPDFCGPEWWADMDIILAECEKRGMKVWVLDDKRFPTGFANGLIASKYPEQAPWSVIEFHVDVIGPAPATAFIATGEVPGEEVLGVYAFARADGGEETTGGYVDLTSSVKDGYAYWDVPEGCYRVYVYVKTRRGTRGGCIDMTSFESCRAQIEAVYEPHYQHYARYFGNTFAGFFSDEPMFGNGLVTRRSNNPDSKFFVMGTVGMALAYNPKVIDMMSEELGEDALPYLGELWYMSEHAPATRHAYMNAVTKLYRDSFSRQLGDWCREHGVMYIGHVIEDHNAHARVGAGAGHYFRALEGQDMGGIDVVLHQVMPGMAHRLHSGSLNTSNIDGPFYHYVLGQLGASLAHQYPHMKGRAMCEEFGAYGWAEGSTLMKWITDFLLVRGINHFVPHAFSPHFPNPDAPPHMGAEGHDPQMDGFTHLMHYTNKAAHLLYGGEHVTSCALLYHAEGEWMNRTDEYMLTQVPAQALLDAHLCYDIVCEDSLKRATVQDGQMVINGEHYGALVVPFAKLLPQDMMADMRRLAEAGLPILLCEGRPEGLCGEVVSVRDLPARMRELGLGDIDVAGDCPLLRHFHIKRDGVDVFMLFNEDGARTADATVTLPVSGRFARLRLIEDLAMQDATEDGRITVHLLPGQSEILVFGESDEVVAGLPKPCELTEAQVLTPTYSIELADADDLATFVPYTTSNELISITSPAAKPSFSGVMRYSFEIDLTAVPDGATLDLGRVGQTARVTVNGRDAGIRIAAPYTYPVAELLRAGKNVVTVDVANTLTGKVQDRFTRYMPIPPSGLLGPVRLLS